MSEKTDVSDVNIDLIINSITEIMERLLTDEYKNLKNKNKDKLLLKLENEFPKFTENNYTLLKMIVNGEDISFFYKMLEMIDSVQKKKKLLMKLKKV